MLIGNTRLTALPSIIIYYPKSWYAAGREKRLTFPPPIMFDFKALSLLYIHALEIKHIHSREKALKSNMLCKHKLTHPSANK